MLIYLSGCCNRNYAIIDLRCFHLRFCYYVVVVVVVVATAFAAAAAAAADCFGGVFIETHD